MCSANLEHSLALYSSFQSANQFLLNSFLEIECNLFFYVWLRLRLGWATKCIEDVLSGQSCCKLGIILTSSYCYLPYYRELLPGCKNASDGSSTDRRTTHKTGDKDGRESLTVFSLLAVAPLARCSHLALPPFRSYAIIIPHVAGIWSGHEMNLGGATGWENETKGPPSLRQSKSFLNQGCHHV